MALADSGPSAQFVIERPHCWSGTVFHIDKYSDNQIQLVNNQGRVAWLVPILGKLETQTPSLKRYCKTKF